MKIDSVVVGIYQENCYILKQDNEALIIDPGDEFEKIKKIVGDMKVVGILVTHHHFDHVGALEECQDEYKVPIYDRSNLKEKEYQVGSFNFEVLFTPGHTDDSVTYYFKENNNMFVGDFIFKGSIGRMDLGGNISDMKNSLKKMINFQNKHENEIINIYSGHGLVTTLEDEIHTNPYFLSL